MIISKGPCPKCGSSDNCKTYDDGHQHCFTPGCGYHTGPTHGDEMPTHKETKAISGPLVPPESGQYKDNAVRKVNATTLRKFKYFIADYQGKPTQYAPFYDQQGDLVIEKVRLPDKSFPQIKGEDAPNILDCKLFGQEFWGDRFDRRVVITEGEWDAMTVAQVMDFKLAVVSVNAGADGAARNLKANYQWLDRFEEIVLFLDADEPGQRAMEECAKLFKIGKVKIARLDGGLKDASEALQKDQPGAITQAVYGASIWKPKGIVNAADCVADLFDDEEADKGWSWPWPRLQEMIGNILPGQVIYLVSGTGMGKSTLSYGLVDHLAHTHNVKNGVMSFEGSRREIMQSLISATVKKRMHMLEVKKEDVIAWHNQTFGTRMIELFDPETAEWSVDAILGYVRFMAKALDCKLIFIDPLSFIAAGMDLAGDERRALDKAARDFAAMAKELNIAIIVSHHLKRPEQGASHEEGAHIGINQIRSSGGIANFSHVVIGVEGDQQGHKPTLRRFRVLKNRPTGKTGIADRLDFNWDTGCYELTNEDYEDDQDNKEGKRGTRGSGSSPDY